MDPSLPWIGAGLWAAVGVFFLVVYWQTKKLEALKPAMLALAAAIVILFVLLASWAARVWPGYPLEQIAKSGATGAGFVPALITMTLFRPWSLPPGLVPRHWPPPHYQGIDTPGVSPRGSSAPGHQSPSSKTASSADKLPSWRFALAAAILGVSG